MKTITTNVCPVCLFSYEQETECSGAPDGSNWHTPMSTEARESQVPEDSDLPPVILPENMPTPEPPSPPLPEESPPPAPTPPVEE